MLSHGVFFYRWRLFYASEIFIISLRSAVSVQRRRRAGPGGRVGRAGLVRFVAAPVPELFFCRRCPLLPIFPSLGVRDCLVRRVLCCIFALLSARVRDRTSNVKIPAVLFRPNAIRFFMKTFFVCRLLSAFRGIQSTLACRPARPYVIACSASAWRYRRSFI